MYGDEVCYMFVVVHTENIINQMDQEIKKSLSKANPVSTADRH